MLRAVPSRIYQSLHARVKSGAIRGIRGATPYDKRRPSLGHRCEIQQSLKHFESWETTVGSLNTTEFHSKSLQHASIAAEIVGDNAEHMSGWLCSITKEAFQLVSRFQYCPLLWVQGVSGDKFAKNRLAGYFFDGVTFNSEV